MKQEASQTFSKLLKQNNNIETLDGPPIDFSFKNIRALHCTSTFMIELPQNIPLPKTSTSPNELKDTNLATTFALTLLESPAISAAIKAGMSAKKGPADGDKDIQQVAEQKLQIVRTIESGDHNYLQSQHKKTTNQKQKKQKKLKKTVTPITTSLLLRYNKLTEIQDFIKFVSPIFPHSLDYLMWVDLSHNRITALSTDLGQLKNLKTLYLHVNYINNFKELQKLKKLALLRTLTIHANPLETYEQFRVLIHSILPTLKKIDSTLLTKRETERAEVLMKTMKKYPVIKNVQKEREESENQEDSDL